MSKPKVICHMMASINGKILTANWESAANSSKFGGIYEKCHESLNSQAWMCGRVTMEKDFSKGLQPELKEPGHLIKREAYIGDSTAASFAIAVDAHGKLGWESNEIYGDHIIEILTEQVSDAYLNYLQQKKISYLFAGIEAIDFELALEQLGSLFPITTLMAEGGGHLNGALLSAGLLDELSLLTIPIADATINTPTVFEMLKETSGTTAVALKLTDVKQLENDVLWLKYNL